MQELTRMAKHERGGQNRQFRCPDALGGNSFCRFGLTIHYNFKLEVAAERQKQKVKSELAHYPLPSSLAFVFNWFNLPP